MMAATPPGHDQQKHGVPSILSFGSKLDILVENIRKSKEKVFKALNDENTKEIKSSLYKLLTACQDIQEEATLVTDFLTKELERNQFVPDEEQGTMTLPAAVTEISGLVKMMEEIAKLLQRDMNRNLQYILEDSKLQKGFVKSSTLRREIRLILNYLATFLSNELIDYSSVLKSMTRSNFLIMAAVTDKEDLSSCVPMLDVKERAESEIKLSAAASKKSPNKTRENSSSHAAATGDIWQENPSHRELMDLLSCISHDWSMLGTCLGLDQNDLSSLQQRLPSSKEKLSEVLHKWKIQQNIHVPYTWQTIKDVVCGPVIQNRKVGSDIEKYLAKKNAPPLSPTPLMSVLALSSKASATAHNNDGVIAVDEQVQTSLEHISDKDLIQYSRHMKHKDPSSLCGYLGFSDETLQEIKQRNKKETVQSYNLLKKWREENPQATKQTLIDIFECLDS